MSTTTTSQTHMDKDTFTGIKLETDNINHRLLVTDKGDVTEDIPESIIKFAKEKDLEKIILTCRKKNRGVFEAAGFRQRARVKGFFQGEDGYFLTAFTDGKRETSARWRQEDRIIEKCMEKERGYKPTKKQYLVKTCEESDIPQMMDLLKTVFETYPTKVFDTDYLKRMMKERILFKAIIEDEKIISMASADMDRENLNAEITDCATYPEHRGRGLLSVIIYSLEQDLKDMDFITVFSLSRAINTGINMVLRKLGYRYNGRLINNCNICGRYEDMNIWSKTL